MKYNPYAVNLDCFMAPQDLTTHLSYLRGKTRVPRAYRAYAVAKAEAMKARLAGDIPTAMRHETECERLYRHLIPVAWRW